MPYSKPRKVKGGWTLPKKAGGVHKSSKGKVVKFKSAAKAKRAGKYIMALENGWKPRKK